LVALITVCAFVIADLVNQPFQKLGLRVPTGGLKVRDHSKR